MRVLNKVADALGVEPEDIPKPAILQRAQEQAWLRGWYGKATNNRQQRPKATQVKRRTSRVGR